MKNKRKDASLSRFKRGVRVAGRKSHANKAAASRRAERNANSGDITHVPDADAPPA